MKDFIKIDFKHCLPLTRQTLLLMKKEEKFINECIKQYYKLSKREYDYLKHFVENKLLSKEIMDAVPVQFPVRVVVYAEPLDPSTLDEIDDDYPPSK